MTSAPMSGGEKGRAGGARGVFRRGREQRLSGCRSLAARAQGFPWFRLVRSAICDNRARSGSCDNYYWDRFSAP